MAEEFYSDRHKSILDGSERLQKAKKIAAVLADFHGTSLKKLNCLDIGCSSGVITNHLAKYFKYAVGIDVDEKAVRLAKKNFRKGNLKFKVGNSTSLEFPADYFDAVVCNQVYQYVKDRKRLMSEIERVLKPNGFCYFAATTRLSAKEMAFLGRGYISYFGLRKLVKEFNVTDYSVRVIKDNRKFYMSGLRVSILNVLPPKMLKAMSFMFPSHIWILTKKK